ncbi:hypothetical protein [Lentibacillus salinarum]|uniref:Arc-like DNA binding domain-containing protein n=1 Tax=Lentibacillus salinarum TaxID=446820 RepID=A0ABW3ZTF4_9BACI
MQGSKKHIERGQSITFRIPSDTPDHLLKQLQKLKDTERRNFSSEIAQYVLRGVNETFSRERETVTIPLPRQLTKEQKNWLKHEHSEALIGNIIYQLLQDPLRAASVLATLTGRESPLASDHEPEPEGQPKVEPDEPSGQETPPDTRFDLDAVDLSQLDDLHETAGDESGDADAVNPLDDFFSKMNK